MRQTPPESRRSYAFGRFQLSEDGSLLVRDGVRVPLAPKVLQTLLVLVERTGQVVRKGELLKAIWPDSFVVETGLTRNISVLRDALGDNDQTLIVTVARIGYRFSATVTLVNGSDALSRSREWPRGDRDGSAEDAPDGGVEPVEKNEVRPEASSLKRLLILPFRLLRDDPDTGFLAFSVPDAVVNALAGLTSLVVRTSAAGSRFSGENFDLVRIAAETNVDAVVTGTMIRSGDWIRTSAQLLKVPCGTVLWTRSLHVPLCEVFELQDRLVADIVGSLSLSLTARERRRLESDVPSSPAAYEFFLRGNESVGPQGIMNASNLRVARELYARAVEEDPGSLPPGRASAAVTI